MDFLDETKQVSKYNDAGLSISRLHENWLRCNTFIRRGSFKQWQYELDMIWLELFPDINRQPNKSELIKSNENLRKKIAVAKTRASLFHALMKRHENLRSLQDVAGKAGVYRDEDEEGFE